MFAALTALLIVASVVTVIVVVGGLFASIPPWGAPIDDMVMAAIALLMLYGLIALIVA